MRAESRRRRPSVSPTLIQPWSLGLVCKCDAIFRPVSRVYNTFGLENPLRGPGPLCRSVRRPGRYVHVRTLQLQDPPNRLPIGSSTPTPASGTPPTPNGMDELEEAGGGSKSRIMTGPDSLSSRTTNKKAYDRANQHQPSEHSTDEPSQQTSRPTDRSTDLRTDGRRIKRKIRAHLCT
ncbi:Uncharacterized protein DBV15_00671 [Temnothorax longispinosus]|uniref:Uncharacterized protein n=1 Tax=Temnothorax longispinosus TaxID=300112 RepID=A0A4S2KMU3_9HYME|nr:Uncharacterized protein DBV15_00671 [Temnothorax longispinosus]